MPSKSCSLCGIDKPLDAFNKRARSPDGHNSYCKDCNTGYQRRWYAANKAKKAATQQRWAAANREHVNARKRELYAQSPESARAKTRRYILRVKAEMVAEYGGECECCGEREHAFLALHHRFGDGGEERRQLRAEGRNPGGTQFYAVLRRRGWPKDRYGLLCHNCNGAVAWYGRCPHQNGGE